MIDFEVNFGVNMVEIITKGLYTNSLDIYREYVQNSCDAIDEAINAGILQEGEGKIEITIDAVARRITIEDNGMGISSARSGFVRIMSNIGNSDKSLKTDRGFRGIGRLCGLAYCKTLIFSTKVAGEKKISTLTIDAENLRKEFFDGNRRSAEEVLKKKMVFDTVETDSDEHFFKVELIDIRETNNALLKVELGKDEDPSKITTVRDYLSFVAPVPYRNLFCEQAKIYEHAKVLNFKITEYKIFVNGEQVVKNYKSSLSGKTGKDEIFDLEFRDFYDEAKNLIAWSWVGLTTFKGVIQQTKEHPNKMRGIRLRAGNIQIGDDEALKNLFSEPRGITYFVGEVYAVDKNLIPTTKRDYFEENEACNVFEEALRKYFAALYDLYHFASDARSAFKAVNAPEKTQKEFNIRSAAYQKSHKAAFEATLVLQKKTADKKTEEIIKIRQDIRDNPIKSQVFERIAKQYPPVQTSDKIIPPPPRYTFNIKG